MFVVGDSHPYFQRFVAPRIEALKIEDTTIDRQYQVLYETEGDCAANSWLRRIYQNTKSALPALDQLAALGLVSQDRKNALINGLTAEVEELHLILDKELLQRRTVSVSQLATTYADRWGRLIGFIDSDASLDLVRRRAKLFLARLSISIPKGATTYSSLLRLQDLAWWKRQLGRYLPRRVDQLARQNGRVSKTREIYVSDAAFGLYAARKQASLEYLQDNSLMNDQGQVFTLADLSEKGVSNPEIRFVEMMVRTKGLEAYADSLGYEGQFVTITAPSKYHRYSKNQNNANWCGANPNEVNKYFKDFWQRIRAKLAREGIHYFGLRVAEPHHDGSPHWHLILFVPPSASSRIKEIFRDYALKEDGDEIGARKYRIDFKKIDKAKGSAAAYIAKYISKSINGQGLTTDLYGKDAISSASRIVAWASIWGIRQFQFFGGSPIGPWRELRRVNTSVCNTYEPFRKAADESDFYSYILQMLSGGLKIYREERLDLETGEVSAPLNKYGEPLVLPIKGVVLGDIDPLVTRFFSWSLVVNEASGARSDAHREAWTRVNNCTVTVSNGASDEAQLSCFDVLPGRFDPPVRFHNH
jgi:hypothetical protein